MVESFAAASALTPTAELRFRWDVPDGWQQGRGAFGGLVLGALLRAMEACEPDPTRRTRSLSGELPAPLLPGPTEVVVEILRRGGGTTFLSARALQGGNTVARASALCAAARPAAAARGALVAPSLPAYATVEALPPPAVGGAAPRFTVNYAYRPVPPLAYAGVEVAAASGWLRLATPLARFDGPAVIGLLDAWWPAALACETRPRPMATVTFTAELLADPATLDPAAPFAYRAYLDAVADGFSVEVRELWQGETLVALNQQVFAMLA